MEHRRAGAGEALYRQLRPGPHGSERNREEVLENQRARIFGAMVEAVAQRGYAAVSVQQVVTLAGVSKRTFYEHFSCKEDCFLTTFDALSLHAIRRLVATYSRQADREERLRTLLGWVLDNVAHRPKEARLRMVEVFAAGPAGHERVHRMQARVEAVIASSLPRGRVENPPPIAVKAIAHGLWHLICAHLFNETLEQLPALTGELYPWMTSYRCAAPDWLRQTPSPTAARRVLVRPFDPSAQDERRRLQRAALHIAGCRGWSALTRPSVCELAGLEERVFEALYGDIDDCFVDALDLLAAEAVVPMLAAGRSASPDWPARLHASIAALLGALAADPVFARAAFVEAAHAGPRGVERANRLLDGFAGLLRRSAPADARPTSAVSQAIAGAVWGIVHEYVRAGACDRLPELAPQLSYVVLAPMVGARPAIESVESIRA